MMLVLLFSSGGLPSRNTHKHRFPSEGSTQQGARQTVAQLGMSLSGDSYLIEDEPLKPRDRCLDYDSRISSRSFPPRNTDKLAVAQSRMNLSDGSYSIADEPR